jgi:hypothetical protein
MVSLGVEAGSEREHVCGTELDAVAAPLAPFGANDDQTTGATTRSSFRCHV